MATEKMTDDDIIASNAVTLLLKTLWCKGLNEAVVVKQQVTRLLKTRNGEKYLYNLAHRLDWVKAAVSAQNFRLARERITVVIDDLEKAIERKDRITEKLPPI